MSYLCAAGNKTLFDFQRFIFCVLTNWVCAADSWGVGVGGENYTKTFSRMVRGMHLCVAATCRQGAAAT